MDTNVIKITDSEREFIKTNRHLVNSNTLAEKFNCSKSYVNMVLRGDRDSNSYTAQNILKAAFKIIKNY